MCDAYRVIVLQHCLLGNQVGSWWLSVFLYVVTPVLYTLCIPKVSKARVRNSRV